MAKADNLPQERLSRYPGDRLLRQVRSPVGLKLIIISLMLLAAAYIVTYYWAEGLWFDELNFLGEFRLRSLTQLVLGLFTLLASLSHCLF